jgi:hypothetical protein
MPVGKFLLLLVEEPLQAELGVPQPLAESRGIQEPETNLGEPLKERRPQEPDKFLRQETSP